MSFVRLDPRDVVVSADTVTAPVWSTNEPTLTAFHTSSAQQAISSADYYAEVYATSSDAAPVQFSIAYADDAGSFFENEIMSAMRANSVKEYMIQKGVDASLIETLTVGDVSPAIAEDGGEEETAPTVDPESSNRVEIRIQ